MELQITQTRHPLSISDGKVIILEQNVIVMNKSQTEKKVYAFYAVSELTLMTLSRFRILQKRRHLTISLIRNLYQDFLKQ